jgi:hypothetical protein
LAVGYLAIISREDIDLETVSKVYRGITTSFIDIKYIYTRTTLQLSIAGLAIVLANPLYIDKGLI